MVMSLGTLQVWVGPARRPAARADTSASRGGSFQVLVYAGVDPLTGKDNYLTESTRDEGQAQKILTRLLAQVDEQRNPRTKATLGAALDAWLRTHEAEETTLDGYRGYVRRTIEPGLATVPLAKLTAQVLEEFYADLRRCRHRCHDGEPAVDHRTAAEHECRTVRHRRRPGRPGRDAARLRGGWLRTSSNARRTPARRWRRPRSGRFTGSSAPHSRPRCDGSGSGPTRQTPRRSRSSGRRSRNRRARPRPRGSSPRRGSRTTTGVRWSGWSW